MQTKRLYLILVCTHAHTSEHLLQSHQQVALRSFPEVLPINISLTLRSIKAKEFLLPETFQHHSATCQVATAPRTPKHLYGCEAPAPRKRKDKDLAVCTKKHISVLFQSRTKLDETDPAAIFHLFKSSCCSGGFNTFLGCFPNLNLPISLQSSYLPQREISF